MTNHLILQRFCRIDLLGIEVEARLDLAEEPVIEAESLGTLLEYQRSRDCRDLVRRLLDRGRLSWRSRSSTATGNSAENSGLTAEVLPSDQRPGAPVDVFVLTEREQVGTVVRDVDKLWLTERACLLVATASETDRAWQVRSALVDFFLAYRRANSGAASSTVVHEMRALREELRTLVDEVRGLRADIVQQLDIDARVRKLEARRERTPPAPPKLVRDPHAAFVLAVERFLGSLPRDTEVCIQDVLRSLELEFTEARARRIGIMLARLGWTCVRRARTDGGHVRVYQRVKSE